MSNPLELYAGTKGFAAAERAGLKLVSDFISEVGLACKHSNSYREFIIDQLRDNDESDLPSVRTLMKRISSWQDKYSEQGACDYECRWAIIRTIIKQLGK